MKKKLLFLWLLWAILISGCSSQSTSSSKLALEPKLDQPAKPVVQDAQPDEVSEKISANRAPNNGAKIRLVSPVDGADLTTGQEVVVKIDYENFPMEQTLNHWHLHVDGQLTQMILSGTEAVIPSLDPGQHQIAIYLALEHHQELEVGDSIDVMVNE